MGFSIDFPPLQIPDLLSLRDIHSSLTLLIPNATHEHMHGNKGKLRSMHDRMHSCGFMQSTKETYTDWDHDPEGPHLAGFILRKTLVQLLSLRKFSKSPEFCKRNLDDIARWEEIEGNYPRYPLIDDVEDALRYGDEEMYIDLSPYMNEAPLTVHYNTSVERAYNLFLSNGLRHLCVVDVHHRIRGIITRKDLTRWWRQKRWRTLSTVDGRPLEREEISLNRFIR